MRFFIPYLLCAICLSTSAFAEDTKTKIDVTGEQIGTTPTQKLGFLGATPIPQQSGSAQAAVASSPLQQFVVSGHNNTGAVTLTGAPIGAAVIGVINLSSPANASTSFESTLSVAGQIQQTSTSNLSGNTYLVTIDSGGTRTLANALRTALVNLGLIKGSN